MRHRLPAYLLDDLNAAERAAVDEALAVDSELREELEKLRECMGCCEAEPEPPQLASRTCHFVEHAIQKSKVLCHRSTGGKSLSESHDALFAPRKWSFADIAVGICVVGALSALIIPALHDNRETTRLSTCQGNQHFIVGALMEYSVFNRGQLPALARNAPVGSYLMQLVDNNLRSRGELELHLVCPSSELAERVSQGCIVVRIPTREEFESANGAQREILARNMSGSYAYNIGYLDDRGELHQVNFSGSREVPMLSDAPSSAIAGFQSANHGGLGQNVTFQDLSCRYCKQCKCKAKLDHWFLNDDGKVAPGLHPRDVVLASGDTVPVIDLRAK